MGGYDLDCRGSIPRKSKALFAPIVQIETQLKQGYMERFF
jgi:hypothetical protein